MAFIARFKVKLSEGEDILDFHTIQSEKLRARLGTTVSSSGSLPPGIWEPTFGG